MQLQQRSTSKDLQQLTWRNFTHCCWMPAIPLVAVWTLDKDGAITQTLCKYLPSNVIKSNPSSCKNTKTNRFIQRNWSLALSHLQQAPAALPICLRVISTVAFRLTFDSRPRQKRSELEGSVNPSTVSEGCEAWKVSPTRWFSS